MGHQRHLRPAVLGLALAILSGQLALTNARAADRAAASAQGLPTHPSRGGSGRVVHLPPPSKTPPRHAVAAKPPLSLPGPQANTTPTVNAPPTVPPTGI